MRWLNGCSQVTSTKKAADVDTTPGRTGVTDLSLLRDWGLLPAGLGCLAYCPTVSLALVQAQRRADSEPKLLFPCLHPGLA